MFPGIRKGPWATGPTSGHHEPTMRRPGHHSPPGHADRVCATGSDDRTALGPIRSSAP